MFSAATATGRRLLDSHRRRGPRRHGFPFDHRKSSALAFSTLERSSRQASQPDSPSDISTEENYVHGKRKLTPVVSLLVFSLTLLAAPAMFAATHCVNQSGSHGCFRTINAAISASGPGDVVQVWPGHYSEDVLVSKSLSLVGAGEHSTIINAMGLLHGMEITGQNHVLVTGFTVENADLSGVFVDHSSAITIHDNHVLNNDRDLSGITCQEIDQQQFANENMDCGEGIHLNAVDHSTISNNLVEHNAGGILVADDTGPTHDNVIADNIVQNNKPDCGITLASHHAGTGVFRNTISGNYSAGNGGAGVGIFAPFPGTNDYANVVINNRIIGNGQPGVTMHNHAAVPNAPPPAAINFSDNIITGNFISRNGTDTPDTPTAGTTGIHLFSQTPMSGTIINRNTITHEQIDVAFDVPAGDPSTADLQVHLNSLARPIGLQNNGSAAVDATLNWWGCSSGPNTRGCSQVTGSGVIFTPWLRTPPPQSFSGHDD
jgi:parallel beta-helix repeat protein